MWETPHRRGRTCDLKGARRHWTRHSQGVSMLRKVVIGAALVATATTGASAEAVYRGAITITAVTPQCQNVHVGDSNTSRFHPKIPGNAGFSGLSFVHQFGA